MSTNEPNDPHVYLSRTMRAALKALADGRSCKVGDRPKHVTIKTMLALRKREMISWDGDHWILTPKGRALADD